MSNQAKGTYFLILFFVFGSLVSYAQPTLIGDGQPHTISYNSNNKVQEFKLPTSITTGRIKFETFGADGGIKKNGNTVRAKGGEGARIIASFAIGQGAGKIPPGATILFIPGEHGQARDNIFANGTGGGGGSAVFYQESNGHWTLLQVAGGGMGGAADCCTQQTDGRPGEPHGCVLVGHSVEGQNNLCLFSGSTLTSLCNSGGGAIHDNTNTSVSDPINGNTSCDACEVGKMGWPGATTIPTNAIKPTGGYGGGTGASSGGPCVTENRRGGFGFGGGGIGASGSGISGCGAGGGYTSHTDRGGGSYINAGLAMSDYSQDRIRRGTTSNPQHGKTIYTIVPDPVVFCNDLTVTLPDTDPVYVPHSSLAVGTYSPVGNTLYFNNPEGYPGTSFDCSDLGDQPITFYIREIGSAFYHTCNVTVRVQRSTPPTVTCNDISIATDANGDATINPAQILQTYQDMCSTSPTSISLDKTSINYTDCSLYGQTLTEIVTLTAQAAGGVSVSCTSTVAVTSNLTDVTPPQVQCKNVAISTDANGHATIVPSQILQDYQDDCTTSPTSISLDKTSFTYTDCTLDGQTQTETVTLTVQDNAGYSASCSSTVTLNIVINDTPPQALCQDLTVSLHGQAQLNVLASQLDAGSYDCGPVSTQIKRPNILLEIKGDRFVNEIDWKITSPDGNTTYAAHRPGAIPYVGSTTVLSGNIFSYDITLDPGCYQFVWDDGSFADGFLCNQAGISPLYYRLTDQDGTVLAYDECEGIKGGATTQFCITRAPVLVNDLSLVCADEGIQEIEVVVTDEAGLQASCTSDVTVLNPGPSCATEVLEVQVPANSTLALSPSEFGNPTTDVCGDPLYYLFGDPGLQLIIEADGYNADIFWDIRSPDLQTTYYTSFGTTYPSNWDNSLPYPERRLASIKRFVIDIPYLKDGSYVFRWRDTFADGFVCEEDNTTSYSYKLITANGTVLASNECEAIGAGQDTPFHLSPGNNSAYTRARYVDYKELDCTDIGYHYVTLGRMTRTGRITTCQRVIKVKPPTPVASCQNISVTLDENDQATFSVEDINNTTIMPCNGYQVLKMEPATTTLDCSNIGTHVVELTIADVFEQKSSCFALIQVRENTLPEAVCQAATVQLDTNGQLTVDANIFDGGSTDNCGVSRLYFDDFNPTRSFNCADVGTTLQTNIIVEDLQGNLNYCNANLTIEDKTPPKLVCKDAIVNLESNGTFALHTALFTESISDNCEVGGGYVDPPLVDCSQVDQDVSVEVAWGDVNGNYATCTVSVAVRDQIAPTMECQDISVYLDENGQGEISVEDIDNGSTDACGGLAFKLDNSSFDCEQLGDNTVTLTAKDGSGNSSSCTAIVTVVDAIAPTITCPADVFIDTEPGLCSAVIMYDISTVDNCPGETWIKSGGIASGAIFPVGTTMNNFLVSDASGNTASCVFIVTVNDAEIPVVSNNLLFLDCVDNEGSDLYEVEALATDNCDENPSVLSVITIPSITDLTIRFKKKNRRKLKFDLNSKQVIVEAPGNGGAEDWWYDEVVPQGGIAAISNQQVKLTEPEKPDELVYKFDHSGILSEVANYSMTLISTATDAAGNPSIPSTFTAFLQCGNSESDLSLPESSSFRSANIPTKPIIGHFKVFPNPFSFRTSIQYEISEPGEVVLDVFDLNGQRVNRLVQENKGIGAHSLEWDGSSFHGVTLPSGIYLLQLRLGKEVMNTRVLLQR